MAFDESLAARVRVHMRDQPSLTEQKMFGGIAFMIGGNMACGVMKDELMVRTGPERFAAALARPCARPMEFTGRAMTGMVSVGTGGLGDPELSEWVDLGVGFAGSLPVKTLGASKRGRRMTSAPRAR